MLTHESPQQIGNINDQLRNFINLLQTTNPVAYKSIKSSGRLSVILSASEPDSSSVDKQNSSQSANLSIKHSQFQTLQSSTLFLTIKQLQSLGLTKQQQKLVSQLLIQIDEILKKKQQSQNRILVLQDQIMQEKKGTDCLLEALIKLDEDQKDLSQNYQQLSDTLKQKTIESELVLNQNHQIKQEIENCKKEIKFLKNLVYLANQNYQQLEDTYQDLFEKYHQLIKINPVTPDPKPMLVLRQKRSQTNLLKELSEKYTHNKSTHSPFKDRQRIKPNSPQFDLSNSCSPVNRTSRSLKSRKSGNSVSPLQKKDKENIECNFKDVYRKMMMKNLKAKKKSIDT